MPSPRNRSKRQSCPSHLWQLSCWLILSGPQTFSHEAATTTIHNTLYRQRKTNEKFRRQDRQAVKHTSEANTMYFSIASNISYTQHTSSSTNSSHQLQILARKSLCSTNLQMWQSITAISLPLGWLFLPSPRLWLLSRPPRCQIPWPFWVLWQPASGTLLSMHSTFATGSPLVIFAYWAKKMTRKCMKIWDLHNPCILGQELETTKAGPPNQKDVLHIQKKYVHVHPTKICKNKKQNQYIGDLAFWQRYACRVDMKTLKSPKDEMTSRYQTVPPRHTHLRLHRFQHFAAFGSANSTGPSMRTGKTAPTV